MALFKYGNNLYCDEPVAFDELLPPGFVVSLSGIYRCATCGDEIAANKGNPLPSQNHRQHLSVAPIRWQLMVCSVQQ
jgi:hypothetical protein